MKTYRLKTESAQETERLGEKLAHLLRAGDVITLAGDLGSGKTTFTKGLARGLGITRTVSSPTFTMIKEYSGTLPLYHMDVYRLANSGEDLGFDEYFYGDGVTVVEWASNILEFLPEQYLEITMKYVAEQVRELSFTPFGERYVNLCEEFVKT